MNEVISLSVKDDVSTLYTVELSDHDHNSADAAHDVIEHLLDWTYEEIEKGDEACYSKEELEAHTVELENLQKQTKRQAVDLTLYPWFKTSLGFTFESDVI